MCRFSDLLFLDGPGVAKKEQPVLLQPMQLHGTGSLIVLLIPINTEPSGMVRKGRKPDNPDWKIPADCPVFSVTPFNYCRARSGAAASGNRPKNTVEITERARTNCGRGSVSGKEDLWADLAEYTLAAKPK